MRLFRSLFFCVSLAVESFVLYKACNISNANHVKLNSVDLYMRITMNRKSNIFLMILLLGFCSLQHKAYAGRAETILCNQTIKSCTTAIVFSEQDNLTEEDLQSCTSCCSQINQITNRSGVNNCLKKCKRVCKSKFNKKKPKPSSNTSSSSGG